MALRVLAPNAIRIEDLVPLLYSSRTGLKNSATMLVLAEARAARFNALVLLGRGMRCSQGSGGVDLDSGYLRVR